MDSRFRKWARHSGAKVISGLLVGAGILVWALSHFLHQRLSRAGLVAGIALVVVGLIVGVISVWLGETVGHHRRYSNTQSGNRRDQRL